VILVLDPDLGAGKVVECRVTVERGGRQVRRDPLARGQDVGEGR
jgi:hypothetical protein